MSYIPSVRRRLRRLDIYGGNDCRRNAETRRVRRVITAAKRLRQPHTRCRHRVHNCSAFCGTKLASNENISCCKTGSDRSHRYAVMPPLRAITCIVYMLGSAHVQACIQCNNNMLISLLSTLVTVSHNDSSRRPRTQI